MSVFENQGSAISGAGGDPERRPPACRRESGTSMVDTLESGQRRLSQFANVDPHNDARAIVRLVQCTACSLPLRQPYTMPCGMSICRPCLPESHRREHISYPMTPDRIEGFLCPFDQCAQNHAVGDCNQDVTLTKVMERVSIEIARYRPITSDTPTLLIERPKWRNIVDSSKAADEPRSRILSGGRLLATYTMAEIGELRHDAELAYQTMSNSGDAYEYLDTAMLQHLKNVTKTEMDCHVCFNLMLDPLTTACGHTFCRSCVLRVLDHSDLCPICRRTLHYSPGHISEAGNQRLSALLNALCPELVLQRLEAQLTEARIVEDNNVPLFVCTLAYPGMPSFLHVFEPRYRLMMRRAIETGDRKFGMVTYNRHGDTQGALGQTQFKQYGTLLHIISMQVLSDGRSFVESVGVSKFRVRSHGMLDGYVVGNIERIDDIPLSEEEAIEAREVGAAVPTDNILTQMNSMSTRDLLRIPLDFMTNMRARSAPWLRDNALLSYGNPPEDPALFPYWFASVLPISEEQKYRLLATTSVRERLKITVVWVRKIESHRW